jgi:hypothetical protein
MVIFIIEFFETILMQYSVGEPSLCLFAYTVSENYGIKSHGN